MTTTPPPPAARALAKALRTARESTGVGLRAFAAKEKLSHTVLGHWETAHRTPNVEQVALLLGKLHVNGDEQEVILDLARKASQRNWLTSGIKGIPQQLAGVIECERAASDITEWLPYGFPGLLQTPDYAREVKLADNLSACNANLLVMVNTGRREVLTRRDPVNLEIFLDVSTLTESADDVMLHQLKFLYEEAERPNIAVRIVPRHRGWHPGWTGPFIRFKFSGAPDVIYHEHYSTSSFVMAEHDVNAYDNAIEFLRNRAKDATESLNLIGSVIQRIEGGSEYENEAMAQIPTQPIHGSVC